MQWLVILVLILQITKAYESGSQNLLHMQGIKYLVKGQLTSLSCFKRLNNNHLIIIQIVNAEKLPAL